MPIRVGSYEAIEVPTQQSGLVVPAPRHQLSLLQIHARPSLVPITPPHVEVRQRFALIDLQPAAVPVGRDGQRAITEHDPGVERVIAAVQQTDEVERVVCDLPGSLIAAPQARRAALGGVVEVDLAFVQKALERPALQPLAVPVELQQFPGLCSQGVFPFRPVDGCVGD